ncbi:MAG: 16S rRNA (cytosine(1402)-N(4))-methyltransferase RsmH [bacterium]
MDYEHLPVLVKETLDYLNVRPGKVYVDCTLGGGGHSQAIKTKELTAEVIGFDQDEEALAAAKSLLKETIIYIDDNFRHLKKHLIKPVDGFLFDLGLSSHQIDTAERGFSIKENGPLDMRMDKEEKVTAADLVNQLRHEELEKIFFQFGEEKFSRRVAKAICHHRLNEPITTTDQLKKIVEEAIPVWKKRESVTRIFQALRIAVNQELDSLQTALTDAMGLLNPGGRIVVISYHSLEDRIVKHTFKQSGLTVLTKKPVMAGEEEVEINPRARSGKLRAAEKS